MEKTSKITTIILWVLMALSVALFAFMIVSIDDELNPSAKAVQMITMNLNWSIVLFGIAAVVAVVFALVQILGDKTKAIRALVSILILGAVLGVSYSLASSAIPSFFGVDKFVADGTLTENVSKWVGTGLYVTYVLFAGAFLSIIGFGVASIFKRS
jgi:hypothetical protein